LRPISQHAEDTAQSGSRLLPHTISSFYFFNKTFYISFMTCTAQNNKTYQNEVQTASGVRERIF
jgi:hypothetical protein